MKCNKIQQQLFDDKNHPAQEHANHCSECSGFLSDKNWMNENSQPPQMTVPENMDKIVLLQCQKIIENKTTESSKIQDIINSQPFVIGMAVLFIFIFLAAAGQNTEHNHTMLSVILCIIFFQNLITAIFVPFIIKSFRINIFTNDKGVSHV